MASKYLYWYFQPVKNLLSSVDQSDSISIHSFHFRTTGRYYLVRWDRWEGGGGGVKRGVGYILAIFLDNTHHIIMCDYNWLTKKRADFKINLQNIWMKSAKNTFQFDFFWFLVLLYSRSTFTFLQAKAEYSPLGLSLRHGFGLGRLS